MIGLLLVTHGSLGQALLESIAIITGRVKGATAIGLYHGDSPEAFREEIKAAVEELDTGLGVLVLVDFFGGTPGNEVLKLLPREKMKVLSGTNLAMLLEIVMGRETSDDLQHIGQQALASARQSIMDMSERYLQMMEKAGG